MLQIILVGSRAWNRCSRAPSRADETGVSRFCGSIRWARWRWRSTSIIASRSRAGRRSRRAASRLRPRRSPRSGVSAGIPRVVKLLCDRALEAAYGQQPPIGAPLIESAARSSIFTRRRNCAGGAVPGAPRCFSRRPTGRRRKRSVRVRSGVSRRHGPIDPNCCWRRQPSSSPWAHGLACARVCARAADTVAAAPPRRRRASLCATSQQRVCGDQRLRHPAPGLRLRLRRRRRRSAGACCCASGGCSNPARGLGCAPAAAPAAAPGPATAPPAAAPTQRRGRRLSSGRGARRSAGDGRSGPASAGGSFEIVVASFRTVTRASALRPSS